MKIKFSLIFCVLILGLKAQHENGLVNWLSFKEAQEKNKIQPKPFLVDIYTDWCGWCKHMMKTTYSNAGLANYINTNFYPVKFNAETKDTVEYNGKKYFPTSVNPKTPHELAIKFLGNSLSYPSTVFITGNFEFSILSQGYLEDKAIEPLLVFMVESVYQRSTYDDFSERFNKAFRDTGFVKKPIKEYSMKEALALQKKKPKKILVSISTGFCHSGTVMNRTTFCDTTIASYIDKNFYLVKFDAESADTVFFRGEKFYKQPINGFPLNTFAFKVSNGMLSLPSIVVLDEELKTIDVLNFYQHPKNLKPILQFYGGDHYKTKKWQDFYGEYTAKKR
jgi:thioredoxin-related protein